MKPVDVPAWSSPRRELSAVEADAERRDRDVSETRWNAAPKPPTTERACDDGPRPCPALRCWFHVGERGDGSLSCVLDVEQPMSLEQVAAALGVSRRSVQLREDAARDTAMRRAPREVLIALRILKRTS